ncbi:Superkiller protein 3 [Podosphaera aphanis]|nr:Superkiller protein 3 [Podosphaera aphanis]
MSCIKAELKAIKASIAARNYEDAIKGAQSILTSAPQNFGASFLLGYALHQLERFQDAEEAYKIASKAKAKDPQSWQGLIRLYELENNKRLEEYRLAVLQLAEIFKAADDMYRCQDVVDKFISFAKDKGTPIQHKRALEILLPNSPIYEYLEGRIPHPSHTYQIMAQITEFDEKDRINRLIGERRTRIGAKIGQVTHDVKLEVLSSSDLESLYNNVILWSHDDEIRRQYEEKLLHRCYELLIILPAGPDKVKKRDEVLKLSNDMVIIKHPFKLAWDITLEWSDLKHIHDYDVTLLRAYCNFFPIAGLSLILRGYMSSELSPFPPAPPSIDRELEQKTTSDSEDDEDDEGGVTLDEHMNGADLLLMMAEGMSDSGKSLLAHRLMGEYYQHLEEYETTVELMRNGQRLILEELNSTGLSFENSSEHFTIILATALVYYQPSKNHPEAKKLFQKLLARDPTSTRALIGIGLIYEEEENYTNASEFFKRALERDVSNIQLKAEAAWVKALQGDFVAGKSELSECLTAINEKDLRSRDILALTQYRIGVCIWNIDTSKASRKDKNGAYAYFLASLKTNLSFAPAYTSLGIYFADYCNDNKRSRKCFQKAFELSSSEVGAARRLAVNFAECGEWDLVETVSQRVIDSGKIRPPLGSKKKCDNWPYAALAVAELNKQDYTKSIVSFQSALRITPNDYHSWIGLSESYLNCGKYIAATKSLQHALKIATDEADQEKLDETWFAKHMLANVRRELGDYDDAIIGYQGVLQARQNEYGVSIALIQALAESALDRLEKGLFGNAITRAIETIDAALVLSKSRPNTFNLWRAVGDACSIFCRLQSRLHEFPLSKVRELLQAGESNEAYDIMIDVDGVGLDVALAEGIYPEDEVDGLNLTRCLHATILAHKRAIYTSSLDMHAQAVAFYNLGWAEYLAHTIIFAGLKKKSTRYMKASIRCFKRSIELEAGNSEFWNALGVVTSEINPKIAQHSFVRSLFLNERSAQTWTNLGTLYLLQNDYLLASEAFTRAQSSDPDFAHAWVAQGILALLLTEDQKEAHNLFTHAIEISDSQSILSKKQYTSVSFDQLSSLNTTSNVIHLVQPLFALRQLEFLVPTDLISRHLTTLFLERINDLSTALNTLFGICSTVETDYDLTESSVSLLRFALAKADLARCQFSTGSYEDAIENGETALQLSLEDADNKASQAAREKCRLSAQLTVGLAHYHSGAMEAAMQYFVPAFEESNGNPDIACLYTQVLWATGDGESRNNARNILFDCVEKHPDHVQSILLLGIIAILDHDRESLDAVVVCLRELRTSKKVSDAQRTILGEILWGITAVFHGIYEQEATSETQTEIFLYPYQPHGWKRLATIKDNQFAAEMALNTSIKALLTRTEIEAVDLSRAYSGIGRTRDTQKAIMVAPWNADGWNSMLDCCK